MFGLSGGFSFHIIWAENNQAFGLALKGTKWKPVAGKCYIIRLVLQQCSFLVGLLVITEKASYDSTSLKRWWISLRILRFYKGCIFYPPNKYHTYLHQENVSNSFIERSLYEKSTWYDFFKNFWKSQMQNLWDTHHMDSPIMFKRKNTVNFGKGHVFFSLQALRMKKFPNMKRYRRVSRLSLTDAADLAVLGLKNYCKITLDMIFS